MMGQRAGADPIHQSHRVEPSGTHPIMPVGPGQTGTWQTGPHASHAQTLLCYLRLILCNLTKVGERALWDREPLVQPGQTHVPWDAVGL